MAFVCQSLSTLSAKAHQFITYHPPNLGHTLNVYKITLKLFLQGKQPLCILPNLLLLWGGF